MKIVISPAKTLDYESDLPAQEFTQLHFQEEAAKLNNALAKKSVKKLEELMSISKPLAKLNRERNLNRTNDYNEQNSRQAVYAFKGDVYLGLDAYTLSPEQIDPMQHKLRILSGLYGILKPLDLIQPYRLEMGTKLKVGRKNNLYEFWGDKVTEYLNQEMEEGEPLINLASNEYFSVINTQKLTAPLVTPVFKDYVNGKLKVVSFHAKKARGMMVRYILDKEIDKTEDLKTFNYGNYEFDVNASTESELVFVR